MPKTTPEPPPSRSPKRLVDLLDKLQKRTVSDAEYEAFRAQSEKYLRRFARNMSFDDIDDIFGDAVTDFLAVADGIPRSEFETEYTRALERHRKRAQRYYRRMLPDENLLLHTSPNDPNEGINLMDRRRVIQKLKESIPRALEVMNSRYRDLITEAWLEPDSRSRSKRSAAESKALERAEAQFGMRLEDALVEKQEALERQGVSDKALEDAIRVIREGLLKDLMDWAKEH